jgi:hypothetical protein
MSRDLTNEKAWCANLMTTTEPQANGKLARLVDVAPQGQPHRLEVGFCCLGIGSKQAGVHWERFDNEDEDEDGAVFYFGTDAVDGLAPREFIEWLGFEVPLGKGTSEFDLVLDWPEDWTLPSHQHIGTDETHRGCVTHDGDRYVHDRTTDCSGLNDNLGLTFAQIGQLVNYIGLKGVRT